MSLCNYFYKDYENSYTIWQEYLVGWKFGEFDESTAIRQTKTIQSSNYK